MPPDLSVYKYVDFHTHMHDKAFEEDSDEVMQNLLEKNILCVTVGTDLAESHKAKKLSEKYKNIYYTVGIHPHDNLKEELNDSNRSDFEELIGKKCLAIGECGLDYFYLEGDKSKGMIQNMDSEVDRQQVLFLAQIDMAAKRSLPLMIHGRCSPGSMDAYEDIIYLLKSYKAEHGFTPKGNVHFFTGDIKVAGEFMELGFTFSFGGVLTLTRDYDEVLKYIPIEYIHAETDSPYVTPKDKNGDKIILSDNKKYKNRNSSDNITIIIDKIAEIKNIKREVLEQKLKENFVKFIN